MYKYEIYEYNGSGMIQVSGDIANVNNIKTLVKDLKKMLNDDTLEYEDSGNKLVYYIRSKNNEKLLILASKYN